MTFGNNFSLEEPCEALPEAPFPLLWGALSPLFTVAGHCREISVCEVIVKVFLSFLSRAPAVPHRPQIWGAVTWELGLECPTEPQGRTMQKDKRENPMRTALGSQGPAQCRVCTVAGVKWYLGFISILVWRLHFCELQEDSLWGAAAPLRGRALWGTCAAELPFCFLRKQNLWILLN